MDRKLYMYVTTDEYELPIAVGTLPELASGLGMKKETHSNKAELEKAVSEYEANGFKVHYNE